MQTDEIETTVSDESEGVIETPERVDASEAPQTVTRAARYIDVNAQANGELELGDVAKEFDANTLTATFAFARSPLDTSQVIATVDIKVRGDLVATGVLNEAQIAALKALLGWWMPSAQAGWARLHVQRVADQDKRKKDETERKARSDKAAREAAERAAKKKVDKKAASRVDPKNVVAPPPLFDIANANAESH